MGKFRYRKRAVKNYLHVETNEARADVAEAALRKTDRYYHDDGAAFTDVSDLIGDLYHFCQRAGIDFRVAVESGEHAARGDLEDGPEAEYDPERFPNA